MSAIKKFVNGLRTLGLINTVTTTIEQELFEVGREIERRRRAGESIHDGQFAQRMNGAFEWANASGFSVTSRNYYLNDGASSLTKGGK